MSQKPSPGRIVHYTLAEQDDVAWLTQACADKPKTCWRHIRPDDGPPAIR